MSSNKTLGRCKDCGHAYWVEDGCRHRLHDRLKKDLLERARAEKRLEWEARKFVKDSSHLSLKDFHKRHMELFKKCG